MAAEPSLRAGSAVVGALALLLVFVAIGATIAFGGFYPVSASQGHLPGVAWLLEESMEHAVKRGAKTLQAPRLTAADTREGGSHFKAMCQQCHGGPRARPDEFATAMNPRPPDLSHAARDWSTEQIFWIAKHGIKMSAMPAFEKTDDDEELWKVAAFAKQLPRISAADYAALPKAQEHERKEGSENTGDNHEHSD